MAIKKEKRRQDSNERYVNALQDKYSKLCVVRVDLGYKKGEVNITLEEANKDLDKLLNNRRSNSIFDNNVGYIFKIENGDEKKVHIHGFVFSNANKERNDKFKCEQIGKYWVKNITNGRGIYHNCNRNDYKDKHALGILNYKDDEKRKNLDKAMAYLVKDDQNIESLAENKNYRAIRRGTLPREKSNKGRPRG